MCVEDNRILHSQVSEELARGKNSKNTFVSNSCGGMSFGRFPSNNCNFVEAEIKLKLGYVGYGPSRRGAFGLRHIWEKHGDELNLSHPSEVSVFIENVISTGAQVLRDMNKYPDRPLIVQSVSGMVILHYEGKADTSYYSIVSAYGRRQHPGTLIAMI